MSYNVYRRSSLGSRRNHTNSRGSSTSNQGARPKMNKDRDLNKNVCVQGRFPSPLPKHITAMWDSITFCFRSNDAPRQKNTQQSIRLDIGKVQFALTSDRKEKSINILKENGVEASLDKTHQIHVKIKKQLTGTNDELQYLESIFETHIISDLDRIDIDVDSSEEKLLIKEPLEEMKQKTVEVYHCGASNVLFVVGEKTHVHQIFLKKENPDLPKSEKRAKDLSLTDSYLLEYLGFVEHITSSNPNAKVQIMQEPPYCVVEESDGPSINVDDEIRLFLDKIEKETLKLSGVLFQKLLFNEYPEPNDTFYCFITNRIPKSLGKVSFYISKSDTGEFYVNCLNKNNAKKVAELVERNIDLVKVKMTGWEEGWAFLKEWSGKKKLFYKEISNDCVECCCTTDISDKFHNVDSSARLSLTDNQARFLRLFGKDFLLDIEQQFGIHATLRESELNLTGKTSNLEKISEDLLQSKLGELRKIMPLDVPIECIENRKDEIDRTMNKRECFWDLKTMKKPVKRLKNCEYLASWIDPMRELKVTVVRGFSWLIDIDLHIVTTNQSLYPLEIVQSQFEDISVPKDFISRGMDIVERKGGKIDVGEYTELPKEMNGCKNVNCVALVVCSDSNNKTFKGLKQKIKEILTQYLKSNITNFGISASERGDAKHLTRQAIEAALEFADAGPGQINELFICCKTAPTQELREVHELFKEKHGFVQNIYSDSTQMLKHTVSDTKIKVIEGGLDELKADIMVNTTNKRLALGEGRLSSTISKMAGPLLQKECKRTYPDGLKKGQLAKTESYNLKNLKFIYHISLPNYNEATFRQDVKTYVKKCLCQAERDECCCIVFPALGVGRLKYPRRETAEEMFDAAEEYCLEVINPVLKSIKFLVDVNDPMTYEAFRDEEYRRSKRCLKDIGLTKPFIKKDFRSLLFGTDQNRPSIKIATLPDFGVPPAYAIEVFIGQVKTEKEIYRKRALDVPPSWNERWFLQRAESKNKVTESFGKFIKKLAELDDRVTEIVIYTSKDSRYNISEEEQVESICCVFSRIARVFLQDVIIVVSDEPSLHRTEKLLKKRGKLAIDRKNTYSRSTELSIELIGKTKKCLNDGETFITDLLLRIKKEIITNVVSRLNMYTGVQMLQQQGTVDSLGSNNEFEVTDEVTAEINHGIVNFTKQNKDWDYWVKEVEKSFRLKVTAPSDDNVTVKGAFSCILSFEDYLDNCFPDDPS